MEDRHRDRSHGQIIAGAQVAVGLGAGTVRRPPIRVNAVPGFIDTPWWAGMPDDARQEFFNQTAQALPVGRIARHRRRHRPSWRPGRHQPQHHRHHIEADGGARLVSLG